MENEYLVELRQREIREIQYNTYWQSREFLQEYFKNHSKADRFDVSEELEEILDFQSADFAREFQKEVLKNFDGLKEILDMGVSKKIGALRQ